MELEQFRDMALESIVVRCDTVQERRNVLELFEGLGFEIGSASMEHLFVEAEEDDDTEYMHPGFSPKNRYVSCYRYFERAKDDVEHAISYEDIQNLIESPPPLDERSDAEFEEDFAALLCGEGLS